MRVIGSVALEGGPTRTFPVDIPDDMLEGKTGDARVQVITDLVEEAANSQYSVDWEEAPL